MTYLLLKGLHLASVLAFVSGLTLLAVVTAAWLPGGSVLLPHEQRIGRQVLRWDRRVTLPALAATWALGLGLAALGGWSGAAWLQGKLVLVVALSAAHGMLSAMLRRRLERGRGATAAWLRFSPALASLGAGGIALLVVLKP